MTSERTWLAREVVVTLLTASEGAALLLEVIDANRWQRRCRVVLRGIVVHLVNWHSCVDHMRLNSLLLNHWLDILVNVVVNMLASNHRRGAMGLLALNAGLLVSVPGLLLA